MMRVIVDCDPGLGKKKSLTDVDDGLALFFMLNQPDLFEIEGITVTYGNTRVKTGYKLLKEYLQLTSRSNLPHYLGANSREDFGSAERLLPQRAAESNQEGTGSGEGREDNRDREISGEIEGTEAKRRGKQGAGRRT